MQRYFNPYERKLAAQAFVTAEALTCQYLRLQGSEKVALPYEVATLREAKEHEVKEGAFAHLCVYGDEEGHFYRICLQDSLILDAVMRSRSFIKLPPLLLYISAHELVHVIRFQSGDAAFDAPAEVRQAEEERVHALTRHILQRQMDHDLKLVIDCFSTQYQIC